VGVACAVLASAAYGAYLLGGATAVPGWLLPVALCTSGVAALAVLFVRRVRGGSRSALTCAALVVACALPFPTVTSVLVATHNLGPFAAPYAPPPAIARSPSDAQRAGTVVRRLGSVFHTPIAFATDTSLLAAPYIYSTGQEVLPIGGYRGGIPSPSLTQLQSYIRSDQVRVFLIPVKPPSSDPRIEWVRTYCAQANHPNQRFQIQLALYNCPSK